MILRDTHGAIFLRASQSLRGRDAVSNRRVRQKPSTETGLSAIEVGTEGFPRLLRAEVNTTLEKGSFYAALLGILSSMIIFSMEYLGLVQNLMVPGIWALVCGLYSLFCFTMAKHGKITGRTQYAVFLPFISLPSVLFIMSHYLLTSGIATYITGPASYLYFFLIVMTGFLFNRVLSTVAGFIVGIQYFVAYLFANNFLQQISAPDPLVLQDLTAMPIYFFKSLMMAFAGAVVGILSSNTRKLIAKVLQEERAKQQAEREGQFVKEIFGKYVAEEIRDEVLAGRIPLDGEMKEVSILFSDLRNFTPMTEAYDPKLVVKVMNSYFEEMAEAIQGQSGLVLQFIGDEIYAVFGAPVFRADHPVRAFRAGMEMRRRLVELNQRHSEKGWPTLSHGIGIHTGTALAANIGSLDRMSYLLVGDTVNLASRLQALNKDLGTEMIVSAATHIHLPDSELVGTSLEKHSPTKIKGKHQRVSFFTVEEA